MSAVEKVTIHLKDEVLAELHRRLTTLRPAIVAEPESRTGVDPNLLAQLVEYWRDEYDWRTAERELNTFDHYVAPVGGLRVHFMRRRPRGPSGTPLILSHGWPWTFWHWSRVVEELARPSSPGSDVPSFDVVVPSLPGFAFSDPSRQPMPFWRIADLWHELMSDVLGHRRYMAAGCDVGALVSAQLGHKYAENVLSVHIGSGQRLDLFNGPRAWSLGGSLPPGLAPEVITRTEVFDRRFAVHMAAQVLAPDTLAHALSDSPVGLLAWLLERWMGWSESGISQKAPFSFDDLLTQATLYWATNTIGPSMRLYADNNRYPWRPSHHGRPVVGTPTGLTLMQFENPPGTDTENRVPALLAQRQGWFNVVHVGLHPRGGHFIPWENPGAWVSDLRSTFQAAAAAGRPTDDEH